MTDALGTRPPAGVLRLIGVRRMFGARGLRAGRLVLDGGEVAAVIGPNASGKSTLLRIAAGILRSEAGYRSGPAATVTGWAEDEPALYLDRTPQEYLQLFRRLRGLGPGVVDDLFVQWELGDVRDVRIGTLSRGQRRRLTLARALMGSPALVILDEPWSGLDVTWRDAADQAVRSVRDNGGAVVLSGHRVAEAVQVADTATLVWGGRTVATVAAGAFGDFVAGMEVRRADASPHRHLADVAGCVSAPERSSVHEVLLPVGDADRFLAAQAERDVAIEWLDDGRPLSLLLDER